MFSRNGGLLISYCHAGIKIQRPGVVSQRSNTIHFPAREPSRPHPGRPSWVLPRAPMRLARSLVYLRPILLRGINSSYLSPMLLGNQKQQCDATSFDWNTRLVDLLMGLYHYQHLSQLGYHLGHGSGTLYMLGLCKEIKRFVC